MAITNSHREGFSRFAFAYALRNLRRNPRRTALTLLTVFIASSVSIVAMRYSAALFRLWEESSADAGAGHAQIHRVGWWNAPDGEKPNLTLPADSDVDRQLRGDPDVIAVAHRVLFEGVISSGAKNLYFLGQGVDPRAESIVSPRLFGDIGLRSRANDAAVPDRLFGDESGTPGIVVGQKLAEALDLHVGDSATLLAQTLEGGMNGVDVVVRGIIDIPLPALSKRTVYVHLDYARRVLGLEGRSSEIVIRLRSHDIADNWVAATRAKLAKAEVDLRGYWEVEPAIRRIAAIFDAVMGMICALLFISTAISVLNIIVMIVNERLTEIGTLLALGARGRDIRILFTLEGALIGALGGIAGMAGGAITIALMATVGLRFHSPLGSGDVLVRPSFSLSTASVVLAVSVLVCMLSALMPAVRAARIEPYAAFRRLVR